MRKRPTGRSRADDLRRPAIPCPRSWRGHRFRPGGGGGGAAGIERIKRLIHTTSMTPQTAQDRVLGDPEFLPYKLDLVDRRVLMVRMGAERRAEASFLDDRALVEGTEGYWLPLQAWLQAPTQRRGEGLSWIFHIGHCGSTLLTRLLQSWEDLQLLREPVPLRTVALAWPRDRPLVAPILDRLKDDWARPLPPTQRTVVKATSSCNALASELLRRGSSAPAIWLDQGLESWLATVLKSPGSIDDVLAAAHERAKFLAGDDPQQQRALRNLEPHRACAMCWHAERVRRDRLVSEGGAILHLDFEALLSDPRRQLERAAGHLGLDVRYVDRAVSSPWWSRYAKAGEHAYGVADRAADLRLSQQRHGALIRDARAWLDSYRGGTSH